MARQWWQRLPAEDRREYQRSAGIRRVEVPSDPDFAPMVDAIGKALEADDQHRTEVASQALVDRINQRLSIPSATVRVEGNRPPDGNSELHGIYHPGEDGGRDRINVWMRTAKRREVVAFRTFLRTLLHEMGHHVDFHVLEFTNSYHTKGFYQRESSLFRIVTRGSSIQADKKSGAKRVPPAPKPAKPDIQRGLALLRAAADDIVRRTRRPD